MRDALGDLLPLAVAIAISPVPVLAVVLMLMSDRGRTNALLFLAGWAVALTAVTGGVAALGLGASTEGDGRGVAIPQLVLAGILLVVIAVEWRGRPRRGEPHRAPRWMALLTGLGPGRALGLGVALVALNVKDGALAAAAGARLADRGLAAPAAIASVAVFVAVASVTVAAPIVADAVLGDRAQLKLQIWHAWLERHGSTAVIASLGLVVAALGAQGLTAL